jgi:hypothetical protein
MHVENKIGRLFPHDIKKLDVSERHECPRREY